MKLLVRGSPGGHEKGKDEQPRAWGRPALPSRQPRPSGLKLPASPLGRCQDLRHFHKAPSREALALPGQPRFCAKGLLAGQSGSSSALVGSPRHSLVLHRYRSILARKAGSHQHPDPEYQVRITVVPGPVGPAAPSGEHLHPSVLSLRL